MRKITLNARFCQRKFMDNWILVVSAGVSGGELLSHLWQVMWLHRFFFFFFDLRHLEAVGFSLCQLMSRCLSCMDPSPSPDLFFPFDHSTPGYESFVSFRMCLVNLKTSSRPHNRCRKHCYVGKRWRILLKTEDFFDLNVQSFPYPSLF